MLGLASLDLDLNWLEHPQPKWYIVYIDIFYHHSLQMLLQPDLQNVPIVKNFTILLQYHPISWCCSKIVN